MVLRLMINKKGIGNDMKIIQKEYNNQNVS